MINSEVEKKDTQVLGISTDPRASQTAFASSLGGVPFPLLTDFHPKGQISKLYGVYNEERGTPNRSVLIIDKTGVVRFKRIYANMSEFDMSEIIDQLDKL